MHKLTPSAALIAALALTIALAGCGSESVPLSGSIRIDGPVEAAPLAKAMARRFTAEHPGVRIAVGASGSEQAFARLCSGRTDATYALATIDAAASAACRRGGVDTGEIPVAHDAVVLVVARRIPVGCLTTAQLRQIWRRNSDVRSRWGEVDRLHPPFDGEMTAWGPGTETEQFVFFNTQINGRWDSYRDYNNALRHFELVIPGVLSTPGNLGYVEYAEYRRHADEVHAIAVDSGAGCVAPTPAAIAGGRYRPLARPLLLYPSTRALRRRAVAEFLRYYLDHVQEVAPRSGFVSPTDAQLDDSRARLERLLAAAEDRSASCKSRAGCSAW